MQVIKVISTTSEAFILTKEYIWYSLSTTFDALYQVVLVTGDLQVRNYVVQCRKCA